MFQYWSLRKLPSRLAQTSLDKEKQNNKKSKTTKIVHTYVKKEKTIR